MVVREDDVTYELRVVERDEDVTYELSEDIRAYELREDDRAYELRVVVRDEDVTYELRVVERDEGVTYELSEEIVAYVAVAVAERRYDDRLEASAKYPLLFIAAVAILFKGKYTLPDETVSPLLHVRDPLSTVLGRVTVPVKEGLFNLAKVSKEVCKSVPLRDIAGVEIFVVKDGLLIFAF